VIVQGAWRLLDRRPAIVADASGVRFHPSFRRDALDWSEVKTVRVAGARPSQLRFDFDRSFWSVSCPLRGRQLAVALRSLNLSYREGEAVAAQLRQWMKAGRKG
jgi:hypothetical protein